MNELFTSLKLKFPHLEHEKDNSTNCTVLLCILNSLCKMLGKYLGLA